MELRSSMTACPVCDEIIFSEMINEHIDSGCKIGFKKRKAEPTPTRQDTPKKLAPLFAKNSTQSVVDMKSPRSKKEAPKPEINSPTSKVNTNIPLAEVIRPQTIDEFFGQEDLLGTSGLLKSLIKSGRIPSMLFWGPPGCGKTTLAKLVGRSSMTPVNFKAITSVTHGIDEVRKIIEQAKYHRRLTGQHSVLFVDEIHRYSKSQQDYFLPAVEQGLITLLAATTENPSFRINSALLSRCKVFVLEKLDETSLVAILKRAQEEKTQSKFSLICDEGLKYIGRVSDGDARHAINALEMIIDSLDNKIPLSVKEVKDVIQRTHMHYDQSGEEHYNLISALHKSIRGSSVEGALYWLGRMLYSGEDPLYIARRFIRMASEDIGLGDSQALPLAVSTYQSCQMLGMPECDVILAHCATYLAQAPKSIQVYRTMKRVKQIVNDEPAYPVPMHIRNAPTKLMKNLGYGDGYIYNPEYPSDHEIVKSQTYLPPELERDGFGQTLRDLMKKDF